MKYATCILLAAGIVFLVCLPPVITVIIDRPDITVYQYRATRFISNYLQKRHCFESCGAAGARAVFCPVEDFAQQDFAQRTSEFLRMIAGKPASYAGNWRVIV